MTPELRLLYVGSAAADQHRLERALSASHKAFVTTAGSLDDLRRLAASGTPFDMLVARLPLAFDATAGWIALVRQLRPAPPILILAAPADEAAARAAEAAGADEILVDGAQDPEAIASAVRRLLASAAGTASTRIPPAASDLRYRELFENVPVGLFVVSPEGRLLDANPALVRILGYADRDDLLSRQVADPGLTGRNEAAAGKAVVVAMEGSEWQVRRCDGKIIWVHTAVRPVFDPQGAPAYYEGTMEDITPQRDQKASLERLAILTESSPNPILEFTDEGRLIYHNQAAT